MCRISCHQFFIFVQLQDYVSWEIKNSAKNLYKKVLDSFYVDENYY